MSEQDPGPAEILRASRALAAITARSLTHLDDLVTYAQWRIMVLIHSQGPMSLTKIATSLGIDLSTASRTADRLVGSKLIRRSLNPEDRRNINLVLTPKGRRIVDDARERRARLVGEVLERLSPAQRRQIAEAMTLFSEAAGEPEGPVQVWGRWA